MGEVESTETKLLYEPFDGVFLPQLFGWKDGEPAERLANVWRFTTAAISKEKLATIAKQRVSISKEKAVAVKPRDRSNHSISSKRLPRNLFPSEEASAAACDQDIP